MRLKSIGRIVNFALRPVGLEIRKRHEVRPSTIPHNDPSLPASFFVECRVLANRLDLLDIIPKTGVVAEIGVADGDFSAEIIARTQPAILHLIDAWDSDRFAAGLARVHSKFNTDISCGSVVVHQGLAVEVLPTLAAKSFDCMYIDTTHAYVETIPRTSSMRRACEGWRPHRRTRFLHRRSRSILGMPLRRDPRSLRVLSRQWLGV
jgi:hypothetical protein